MFNERDFFVITSTKVLYKYMADLYWKAAKFPEVYPNHRIYVFNIKNFA
jgi:hypothetical protein